MADWRQIQARIRKAKFGPEAPAKLTQLYDRTQDAMVAFELAAALEKEGRAEEAVRWYTIAAQRFRRAEWKQKAHEALTRLGAPIPEESAEIIEPPPAPAEAENVQAAPAAEIAEPQEPQAAPPQKAGTLQEAGKGRSRRRGRRGGRGRRGRGREAVPAVGVAPAAPPREAEPIPAREVERPPEPRRGRPQPPPRPPVAEAEPEPEPVVRHTVRSGEPALSSKIAHLESQLRRLIASPAHSLAEAEEAPAGPGVLLLSDSDLVTHYYIEACQTIRIALSNLVKTGRGGSREASVPFRTGLAEHLGISEAKVKDYLKKHCTARWIQLDEGAGQLAHFAIAVLRPVVNE